RNVRLGFVHPARIVIDARTVQRLGRLGTGRALQYGGRACGADEQRAEDEGSQATRRFREHVIDLRWSAYKIAPLPAWIKASPGSPAEGCRPSDPEGARRHPVLTVGATSWMRQYSRRAPPDRSAMTANAT